MYYTSQFTFNFVLTLLWSPTLIKSVRMVTAFQLLTIMSKPHNRIWSKENVPILNNQLINKSTMARHSSVTENISFLS
jgi:hypothetical protein